MRAIDHYRLDGLDPTIRAAGHTVFDLAVAPRLSSRTHLNFTADNLLDRS